MSYFGTQLEELLKRKNMKAVDLARLSGVGQPMISRYRKGENTWLSMEDLGRLARAISDEPHEQAELIRAHLLDECKGPGSELVHITIADRPLLQESSVPYQVKLPEELEKHFAAIREWVIKDPNVREVIEGLGSLLASQPTKEPAPSADPRQAIVGIVKKHHPKPRPKASRAEGKSGPPEHAPEKPPAAPRAVQP